MVNHRTTALISHASKAMFKILQARVQQYMNHELPDVQTGFRKGRGIRDQIANTLWIIEKAKEFQKNSSISSLLTTSKPLTVWITINWGIFLKRWEYHTTLLASWETNWTWNNRLVQNWEKYNCTLYTVYCHPAYLTYMQSTSYRTLGWITSWNQDCLEKYQEPQIFRWYHFNGRK